MGSPGIILTSEFELPGTTYEGMIEYIDRDGAKIFTAKDINGETMTIQDEADLLVQSDIFEENIYSIFDGKDFANYINYMGRQQALQQKEKLSPTELEELKVLKKETDPVNEQLMKKRERLSQEKVLSLKTGLFNFENEDLSLDQKKVIQKKFSDAELNGSILFKDVISFDTDFLIEQKLYNPYTNELDRKAIVDASRTMMKKFFEKEKMTDTGIWVAEIHYNTKHFHIHFSTTETVNTRKLMPDGQPRGKRVLSTINQMKSTFGNELADNTRSILREQISDLRNDFVRSMRERLNEDRLSDQLVALVENVRNALPENRSLWNYKNATPELKESLNHLTDHLFEKDPSFQKFKELAEKEYGINKRIYGESKNPKFNSFDNRIEDIYKRTGNAALKEIKKMDANSSLYENFSSNNKTSEFTYATKKAARKISSSMRSSYEEYKNEQQYEQMQRAIDQQKEAAKYR